MKYNGSFGTVPLRTHQSDKFCKTDVSIASNSEMEKEVYMRSSPAKSQVKPIRIWISANRRLVLDSLSFLFESNRQFALVGATDFDSYRSQLAKASKVDIGVVYLEPGDPVEVVRDLNTCLPNVRIISVTDGSDLESSIKALKFGAVGIVQSMQGSHSLLEAIKKACVGETSLNQELLTNLLRKGGSAKGQSGSLGPANDSLTARELEVITLIGKGFKSKRIAEELSISQATVRHHLSSIYGKLGVDDRLNLMIYAFEKGLIRL